MSSYPSDQTSRDPSTPLPSFKDSKSHQPKSLAATHPSKSKSSTKKSTKLVSLLLSQSRPSLKFTPSWSATLHTEVNSKTFKLELTSSILTFHQPIWFTTQLPTCLAMLPISTASTDSSSTTMVLISKSPPSGTETTSSSQP